jgi:hypothetical protein
MRFLTIFVLILFMAAGCDKFEGDQTVPAYLSVDTISFESENDIQGTNNQKITDVWVYVDDEIIGGFEMPAVIPVLAQGAHKLELRAGIMLNGISDTRAPNPCFKPIIYDTYNLYPDSTTSAAGTSSYYDNVDYVWMESFEDASLAIHASQNSDTGIVRTSPAGNPDAFLLDNSLFSGISVLDTVNPDLELVSDNGSGGGFAFDRGDYIFLEMNYKNNIPLVVGVYITYMDYTVEQRSFLVVSPSETWNKIYVNFTPMVNETVDALTYRIYIQAQLPDDMDQTEILLDNLKLVTRPNL